MDFKEYNENLKLAEAKQMRRRVDEDARLLANRIALLKQEDLKATKKIEETRRKAQEIIEARSRSAKESQKHEMSQREKSEQIKLQNQQLRLQREREKSIKKQANQYRFEQAMQEVKAIKILQHNNLKSLGYKALEDLSHKVTLKNKIKEQERAVEEKKKKIMQEKIEASRIEMLKKAEHEDSVRRAKEEHLSKLEQKELELIQRLQNTQIMQKTAYEDLESALSGQLH